VSIITLVITRIGGNLLISYAEGAHVYYFHRIFHHWDQERGHAVLCNIKSAMKQHSRILIAGIALLDVDPPRDMALQDLNMMSFGAIERSETQWRELVEGAGLVLRRV
jgi:ferritin-like protein